MKRLFSFFFLVALVALLFFGLSVVRTKSVEPANRITVFLFYNDRLYPVFRHLTEGQNPIKQSIAELWRGPSEEELKRGLSTLIPQDLQIKQLNLQGEVLEIYFDKSLLNLSGGNALIEGMLSQIVYTVTQSPAVKSVRFKIFEVPGDTLALGGEGYIIDQPLDRAYFIRR